MTSLVAYFRHLAQLTELRDTALINLKVAESFVDAKGLAYGARPSIEKGILRVKQNIADINELSELPGDPMYQFSNLPKKNELGIDCKFTEGCYRVQTTEGWMICEISRASHLATANDIADAIRRARDAGYQQALDDARKFLGIKE